MSIETKGNVKLGTPEGSFSFVGLEDELRELIRPDYSDSKGFIAGNAGGAATIYSDNNHVLHKFPIGVEFPITIHDGTTEHSYPEFEHITQEAPAFTNSVFISQSVYPKTAPVGTKMRIQVVHTSSGNVVYQNCSEDEFDNDNAGMDITEGVENTYTYNPPLPLIYGETYTYTVEFSEAVVMYGDETSIKQKFVTQPVQVNEVSNYKEFSESETYDIGDVVWYNDAHYYCISDGTTGAWDSAKWYDLDVPHYGSSTSYTEGSIPFGGADGYLTQDNTNLFWDDTNYILTAKNLTTDKIYLTGSGTNYIDWSSGDDWFRFSAGIQAPTITSDGDLNGNHLTVATADITDYLETPIIENSTGDLKINPDAQGNVVLFGDTDVGVGESGREFVMWKMTTEGNKYMRMYFGTGGNGAILTNSSLLLQAQNTLNLTSVDGDMNFKVGDNAGEKKFYFKDSDSADLVVIDSSGDTNINGVLTLDTNNGGSLNVVRGTQNIIKTLLNSTYTDIRFEGSKNENRIGTFIDKGFRIVTNSINRVTIDNAGLVGFNTTNPEYPFDMVGSGHLSQLRLTDSTLDEDTKTGGFNVRHYTNAEEDIFGINISSHSSATILWYGGGSGIYNSVTEHRFFAGATTTELTGTQILTIDDSGIVVDGNVDVTGNITVDGTINELKLYGDTTSNNMYLGTQSTPSFPGTSNENIWIGGVILDSLTLASDKNIIIAMNGDMSNVQNCSDNVVVGIHSCRDVSTFSNCTIVGNDSLIAENNLERVVAIGDHVGNNNITLTDSILIGYDVATPGSDTDYYMNIGDLIKGNLESGEYHIRISRTTTKPALSEMFSVDGDTKLEGYLTVTGMPTSDPSVAGRLWNDGGFAKVSSG